jgi:hypothetical protein
MKELKRYLTDGRRGIVTFERHMPGSARALLVRIYGEQIEGGATFWVTHQDEEVETFAFERLEGR